MISVRICKNVGDSLGPDYMKNFDREDNTERTAEHETLATRKLLSSKLYSGSHSMIFLSKFRMKSPFFAKQFL